MSIVLHLLPSATWERLAEDEPVTAASLDTEGFIHCTDDPSVMLQVANAVYASQPGEFVVLHVEVDRLTSRCVWEEPSHPAGHTGPSFAPSFPHVYGPIDRDSVLGVQAVRRDGSGRFTGYGELGPSI
ncbi:MAG: DUF952 domain-containing protein [Ilumatobacteraceae bacterium]